MDEDIDIEEHDVLDNPKIRNIFPDLSLVKIEPPDANDREIQHNVPVEYESHFDLMTPNIKREVLSDDENDYPSAYNHSESDHNYVRTSNYNFDESGQSATYEHEQSTTYENEQSSAYGHEQSALFEYEQSNPYENEQSAVYYNEQIEKTIYEQNGLENQCNKIILGTKPVLDYDELYKEALNSKAIVYLEDWGMKLNTSPCFCHSCEILYPTVNCLDAHKSVAHSLLVAMDTPRNETSYVKNTARKSTVNSTYCNHCDKTFPSQKELITHLYKLLPIENYKIPTPVKVGVNSVHYKCVKCNLHFASVEDGKIHNMSCHPDLNNDNLLVKVQKIMNTNENVTRELAKMDQSCFLKLPNVPLVPKGILFQCNKCLVCFLSYTSAVQHINRCLNKSDYRNCEICNHKIRTNHFKGHEIQHSYNDKLKIYTLNKSFKGKILFKCPKCCICFDEKGLLAHHLTCNGDRINFSRCDECEIDIKDLRITNHMMMHKRYNKKNFIIIEFYDLNVVNKEHDKSILYYCDICGSYKTLKSFKGHTNGSCKNLLVKFCNICGLGFGKIHYRIHKATHQNLKLNSIKDFKIISLYTGEEMDPPIPNYYRCDKCHVHFLLKQEIGIHTCGKEKYILCKVCNEKYNLKAFQPHKKFHDFKRHNFTDDMPDLLKLYNAINNMWDIVYMCSECNVVTVTYDSAVEHSQDHICHEKNNMYVTCDTCNFNIVEKDYKIHENLHENNSAITREQFRILRFNYKDMYKKKWMNIFLPLPVKDKHQILSKSIYRCTRRFKLNCEIYCRTDDTKIYCKKCKTTVDIEYMKRHYFEGVCKYTSKYLCKVCKMAFKNLHDCVNHENGHENSNKTYKIYSFNGKNDKSINEKLLNFDCNKIKIEPSVLVSKSVRNYVKKPLNKMALSKNKFKLYKCKKCGNCVSIKKNIYKHKCSAIKSVICRICNNYFFARSLKKHIEMHSYYGKISTVTYFNPTSESQKSQKAVIYKCDCGLHFTTRQSIENHLSKCNDDLDISKETCSKCHRLFPTDVLVTHLCKHHSKPITFQVIEIPKKSNFKCGFCNVIYLNMVNFDNHIFQCPLKYGKICDQCCLAYDPKSFNEHNCDANQSTIVVKKSVCTSTVYKCVPCNLHYLNRKSIRYHFDQKHICLRKIVQCEICNLRFVEQSTKKHKILHESIKKQYMIKIIDNLGNSHIIKGYNHINDNHTTVTYDSDDTNINDKTEGILESSFKEEIEEFPKVSNKDKIEIDAANVKTRLYRCNSCNLCYHFKKTYDYHLEMKHVNKRPVIKCQLCGLRFTQNSMNNHARVHETGNEYFIQVHEMDEGKITEFKGINTEIVTGKVVIEKEDKKRPAESPVSTLRMKTRKSNNTNVFITDDRHEAGQAMIDFDSVTMTNENKNNTNQGNESNDCLNDVTDPLVDSLEISVTDDRDHNINDDTNIESELNTNEMTLTHRMKSLLHANIKSYSNVLYQCVRCRVYFLTPMAYVSHCKRTDHNKPFKAVNCDECGFSFSVPTLARHKYIHHELMKLTADAMYVLPVSEEHYTKAKIEDLLQNVIGDKRQIDKANEKHIDNYNNTTDKSMEITEDVTSDASTDEVNMDVDKDVVNNSQIHIYHEPPNCNTENDMPKTSNANDNINIDKVNLDENVKKETKIHYYKCADCNVCFIKEDMCKTHCISHKKFDPRLYIECKMCNFQFSLDSLMEHVTLHHDSEFCLEDLAVTEYTPSIDGHIKIDTYLGIDKVQSRLVSTTTDLSEVKSITPVNLEISG